MLHFLSIALAYPSEVEAGNQLAHIRVPEGTRSRETWRVGPIGVQFILFCLVGVLNTAVDICLYYILSRYALPEFLVLSKAASYIAATGVSFAANRHWTFGKRESVRFSEIRRFYSSVGLGIFINVGALYGAVHLLHMHDIIGAFMAALATAVWGFSFAKWYVFKH